MVRKNVIIRTLLIVMTFPLFFVVRNTSALTYSTDVGVQFTFNPALQIDLSSADILIPSLSPGTTADSNVIDVIVKTNNVTGYTLNATVGNNTTYDTRDLVHEVSGSSANFASINYGSSLASLTTDNTWGYSYSTDGGSNWEDYDGLPLYSDTTNIATLKDASTPPATNAGDIVNFKIAAKASASQASGDYNNVINFIATANPIPTLGPVACESGKICYNANVLDPTEVEGTMGKQVYANGTGSGSTITGGSAATLLASNFSRDGYGFAGWSDTYDYTGNLYGPQEEITTPADMSSGLPLYAIWTPSAGSMQTSDATSACNSLTPASLGSKSLASVTALTDQRDNETYAIAKLADGKCWMIENLRLDNSATLTTINTNNPLNDGTNVTLKHNYADTETYNTLSASQDPTTTAWCQSDSASCDDQSMLFTGNTTNRASYETGATMTNSANIYSYGNYYNWYSATAGRGTRSFSANNNSVAGDLCPTGWHLPKGGRKANVDVSDFWKLSRATIGADPANFANDYFYYDGTPEGMDASNKMRAYPNNFVYSGYVDGGSVLDRGSYGGWWSSTVLSSYYAYFLYLNSSSVYPGTNNVVKYYGWTVRCVVSGV